MRMACKRHEVIITLLTFCSFFGCYSLATTHCGVFQYVSNYKILILSAFITLEIVNKCKFTDMLREPACNSKQSSCKPHSFFIESFKINFFVWWIVFDVVFLFTFFFCFFGSFSSYNGFFLILFSLLLWFRFLRRCL